MRYIMLNGTIAVNTRLEVIPKERSRPDFRYHSIIFLVEVRKATKQHNENSRFRTGIQMRGILIQSRSATHSLQHSWCSYYGDQFNIPLSRKHQLII
jgi:hypothetical protein